MNKKQQKKKVEAKAASIKLKKQLSELRIKNKQEIAIARKKLAADLDNYKIDLANAKRNEKVLLHKLKEEEISARQKAKEESIKENSSLKKDITLINENRKIFREENILQKKEIALEKKRIRNLRLEAMKESREKIALIKAQIRAERKASRITLAKTQQENSLNRKETQKAIMVKKAELNELKINQKKLLSEKKAELFTNKQRLKEKRLNKRIADRKKKEAKLQQAKLTKLEIKHRKLEMKKDFAERMTKIKEEDILKKSQLKAQRALLKSTHDMSAAEIKAQVNKSKASLENVKLSKQEELTKVKEESSLRITEAKLQKQNIANEKEWNLEVETFEKRKEASKKHIEGQALQIVGKSEMRLFNRINKTTTKLDLKRIKIPTDELNSVKEFEAIKDSEEIIEVAEFAKYIGFIFDKSFTPGQIKARIASTIVPLTKGKSLRFLNGYFKIDRVRGYRMLTFSKHLTTASYNVVSMPKTDMFKKLEQVIGKKLDSEGIIKITNNLAIKKEGGEIKVLNGLAFLR